MPHAAEGAGEPGVLILGAEIPGLGAVDVRVAAGRIRALQGGLSPEPHERVVHARGGALLPGLHDHHIHLLALSAALRSVRCGPPQIRDRAQLTQALRRARPDPTDGWIRGVGYHDSVAGPLDRSLLDAMRSDLPLRVQHRSGALWGINTPGLRALGLAAGTEAPPGVERDAGGGFRGRILREDPWLRERLPTPPTPNLAEVGALLARRGVTGITDATPHNDGETLALFCGACSRGELPQRLRVMGTSELPEPGHPAVERGPLKIWLADAALPAFEDLALRIQDAHAEGRGVAIHCVTRAELVLAAAALAGVGSLAGDRIEHASVAPPDLVEQLAGLRVSVVTQPNFLYERGDAYATEVEAVDRPWLYRCRGFLEANIPLGAGTDAPFGSADPWRAMGAAVERRSAGGIQLGPDEALSPERALALFTTPLAAPGGSPRRVTPGAPADLCLLDRPWDEARQDLTRAQVALTLCRGQLAWTSEP